MSEGRLKFAFKVTRGSMPADLPTITEIYSSNEHLKPPADQCVVRVNNYFVVKYGPNVSYREGENLLFVYHQTEIPVPTLYAMFRNEDTQENFIVMEFIQGTPLDKIWTSLNDTGKNNIASQLTDYLDQLRNLESNGYIGGVREQSMRTQYFIERTNSAWAGRSEDVITSEGPWSSEAQFAQAMGQRVARNLGNESKNQGDFYMRQILQVFKDHNIVFTHGDLNRENILVRRDGTLALVDWEYSGYLPSFWEYCMCLVTHVFDDDWHATVAKILKEWPAEYAWMRILTEVIIYE